MKSWLCLVLMVPMVAFAGKKDKPAKVKKLPAEYAKHFADVAPAGGDVKYGVSDAWARDAQAKVKLTIENGTPDFLVMNTNTVRVSFGAAEFTPDTGLKGEFVVVDPKGSASRVLKIDGSGMQTDAATVSVPAVSRVPADSPVIAAPDFRLPLELPSFEAGPVRCQVPDGKLKKETDETLVKFKCQYTGDGVVLVDWGRAQIRLEDGQLFANEDRPSGVKVFQAGEDFGFLTGFKVDAKITDMQFATMHIQWNDTFREGALNPIDPAKIALTLDPALTAEKNK